MGKQYFGTDGIRGRVGESRINPEFVQKLGWAVGRVLAADVNPRVVIGKDTRISGYMLESALEAGLSAAGVEVLLLGVMPTPAIAYLARTFRASAGIVISASHNPFYDNGVKFFSSDGRKVSDLLERAIEAEMEKPMQVVLSESLGRAERVADAPGRYIEFCKSTFPNQLTLSNLSIVVDTANGAAYHIAAKVFHELGAEVFAIGDEPNGLNINEGFGATSPEALQRAVRLHKADLGIALDGDADRLILVDHKGEIVDGDEILCILAHGLIDEGKKPEGVVGTLMSNLGLEQSLKKVGIDFVRANVGDRYVMEALQLRDWQLGGESSGHLVNLDMTTTGDGLISALQVLRVMQFAEKSLYQLKQCMTKCPMKMVNVIANKPADTVALPAVQKAVKAVEAELGENGRVLLRASGTEPKVRVMVEAVDEAMVDQMVDRLVKVVQGEL